MSKAKSYYMTYHVVIVTVFQPEPSSHDTQYTYHKAEVKALLLWVNILGASKMTHSLTNSCYEARLQLC